MPLRSTAFAVTCMVLAACTSAGSGSPSTSIGVDTPTTTVPASGQIPGRLVVLDSAGNIVTIDPDGASPAPVTDDAGDSVRYAQPTWSPDSKRLAWAEQTAAGGAIGFARPDGADRSSTAVGSPPFYMYWSPDGRGMGVLHNGIEEIEFELVETETGTAQVVAGGTPFYFSWSPASDQVVAHVDQEDLITIALDGSAASVGTTVAGYAAPHWTGEGIFHLGPSGLELLGASGAGTVVATVRGPLAMVANNQGERLALQMYADDDSGLSAALSEAPALPANSVVVLDVTTGRVTEVSDGLSVGFFWSPDGEKLLVLDPAGEPGEAEVLVWDGESTAVHFRIAPHPLFVRDVLQFFDQYSQSLQLWSPDSSAFALAGEIEGEAGIWVHQVGSTSPNNVYDGTWAAWSN